MSKEEIEAHARDLQANRRQVTEQVAEVDRIGLGETGKFDVDIYGTTNRFEGYVDSIAANEDVDEDDIIQHSYLIGLGRIIRHRCPLSTIFLKQRKTMTHLRIINDKLSLNGKDIMNTFVRLAKWSSHQIEGILL
jgi:hypothetical protein